MPKLLTDVTIRRRDLRVTVDWRELKDLIARAAMAECGITGAPGVDGVTVDVDLKQSEAGSPSYRIGEWTATVSVTLPVD